MLEGWRRLPIGQARGDAGEDSPDRMRSLGGEGAIVDDRAGTRAGRSPK